MPMSGSGRFCPARRCKQANSPPHNPNRRFIDNPCAGFCVPEPLGWISGLWRLEEPRTAGFAKLAGRGEWAK